ncbi:MAG: NADH-quinone oxidoreductase subunit A [Verrucomicrobiales bacterium]
MLSSDMLSDYLPIFLHLVVAIGFAGVALLVSVLLGKSGRRTATKDSAYECGMLPIGPNQPRFSVKFYLVAMLFIIFDLEMVFMVPWAVVFQDLVQESKMVLWSMLSFVGILLVAYIYALRKGALDWKTSS